jgi:hypothetical protein
MGAPHRIDAHQHVALFGKEPPTHAGNPWGAQSSDLSITALPQWSGAKSL